MSFQIDRHMDRLARLLKQIPPGRALDCAAVEPLLSAYADAIPEDVTRIESHLLACEACRGELETLRRIPVYLRSAERPEVPKHLAVEARLRLSQVRSADRRSEGWAAAILDTIQPLAIRAALGVSVSTVLFGLLSFALASQPAMANPGPDPGYREAQTTEDARMRMAGSDEEGTEGFAGAIMVEAYIGPNGHVTGFRVVQGDMDADTIHDIWDRLYFAQFQPARSLGVPVRSSLMLSFVAVQS